MLLDCCINPAVSIAARRLFYTVRLQAALAPGDAIESILLVGSAANDTGERPIVAYLFGVEASQSSNQSVSVVRPFRPPLHQPHTQMLLACTNTIM